MKLSYTRLNNLIGWLVFAIAAFTYTSTIEPTVSFWDCGEYLATSTKLEVGHPPGAPLFQLVAAIVSHLAFGDLSQKAMFVNLLSALCSAFTILFLFWTITSLGRKFTRHYGEMSCSRMTSILGAGVVGALAYTFSDSFWFSATESEVYAMSSFLTALAFWAILKWEHEVGHSSRAHRWLILIAYIIGLSIGVHILVFLTIPAIVMVYFFKLKPQMNWRQFLLYNAIAVGVLGIVFAVIIPFILSLFGKMEIFFVNQLGLPFNSGTLFVLLLLTGAAAFGLTYTRRKGLPLWNTIILCTIFILLGYSSFITLAIRSNANTPLDENNPEDALSLLAYYNRDQYGDWPVLYGQYFNAPLDPKEPFVDGGPIYEKDEELGRYVVSYDRKSAIRNYDDRYTGFFPRMWSDDQSRGHVRNYIKIAGLRSKDKRPGFAQNLHFFFDYQLGHMWWRYFMWNFAGRQNDQQHRYELTKGNWLSGIDFIDEARLGPQDKLPYHMRENQARNTYFLLPFILGFTGLFYHYKRDRKNAWVVTLFFLMTGIAVVIYTNHKPFEPRERDYAFVGSFYAFAIWIGMGVMALVELIARKKKKILLPLVVSGACILLVPAVMASQNWDDHDRSGRFVARDLAKASLDSCAPNAILFTSADNDTFPLWYVQEVEGYRTDVRVVCLSLLNTDWYIDQMKRAAYEAGPVPFSFTHDQYKQGTRDVVYYRPDPRVKGRWKAEDLIKWIKSDDPGTRFSYAGQQLQYFPTRKLRIGIDKQAVLKNKVVDAGRADEIVPYIDWNLQSNALPKDDIMLVDLIAHNNWERPIYFSTTMGNSPESLYWLQDYLRLEGLAYRFVPVKTEAPKGSRDFGEVDTDRMYNNLMRKFSYGNMEEPGVYLDETCRRPSPNLRTAFGRLGKSLVKEGKPQKAIEVLDFCTAKLPESKFPFDYFELGIIEGYYRAGAAEKAHDLLDLFAVRLEEQLSYFQQFKAKDRENIRPEIQLAAQYFQLLLRLSQQYENPGTNPQNNELFRRYRQAVQPFGIA